jgi:RNA-directed DNA polymerase
MGASKSHRISRWCAVKQGDRVLARLVRYADDCVVVSRTAAACEEAERTVRENLKRLGLTLHPEKTGSVELSWRRRGFDFFLCHLPQRMSARIWEQRGQRVYFLQRWPSFRCVKRVRARIQELTDRRRNRVSDARELIDRLNPVLRGWGNYFRTGNAANQLIRIDNYVVQERK